MKRLTLLVVLLGVMGLAAGFALEVKPAFALAGSASVTWGIDLDNVTTGFVNAGSADLTVTLVALNSTDTHAGKEGLYGSITISNLTLLWIDGALNTGDSVAGASEAAVSARLVAGPISVGINGAPGMSSDSVVAIEDATDTGVAIINTILAAETTYVFSQYASGHGTWVKYTADKFAVTLDVTSNGDYTTTTPNTGNGYAIGLEGSVTAISPLTIGLGVFQGLSWTTNPTGGYVSLGVDVGTVGTFGAAFDWSGFTTFTWEASAKAQLYFNKEKTAYLLARVYFDPAAAGNSLDSAVAFMVPAKTLFGPVNFDVTAYLLDLTLATKTIGVLSHAGYTMTLGNGMDVAPSIIAAFTTHIGGTATSALTLTPQVVVTLAKAPTTTLTLAYTSGDFLAATPGLGTITMALGVTY